MNRSEAFPALAFSVLEGALERPFGSIVEEKKSAHEKTWLLRRGKERGREKQQQQCARTKVQNRVRSVKIVMIDDTFSQPNWSVLLGSTNTERNCKKRIINTKRERERQSLDPAHL